MTSSASVVQPVIIEVVPAPLLRRLGAILYDALLLIAVLVGATGLAMGIVAMLAGAAAIQSDGAFTGHPLFRTYILLICFIFYGGFWVHGGQTLGLRAWRLRVQRANGASLGWWQALWRFLSSGLWLVVLIVVHGALRPGIGWSLCAGLVALLLSLALRLPDRWSATELVFMRRVPKPQS